MATGDKPANNDPARALDLTAVQVEVNGTTVIAEYEVVSDVLLLNSADFGNASAELRGLLPGDVAVRLLRGKAEAAMAHGDEQFIRDDEVNAPDAPDE